MNYEEFASDISEAAAFSFESVKENEESLQRLGVNQTMRQSGSGRYQCKLAAKSTPQAELISDRFNLAVTLSLEPPEGCVAFLFPRTVSGQFLASGFDLGNDSNLFFNEKAHADISVPELVGSDSLVITKQRFGELTHLLYPDFEPGPGLSLISGDGARLVALRDRITQLVAQRNCVDTGDLACVMAGAVSCLVELSGKAPQTTQTGIESRWRIARNARDYIEQNFHDNIEIEQLCQITGAGVRTLQRSFQQCFGMTISEYHKTARLDALDRALRSNSPRDTTIAELCLQSGITHFGRGSTQYRERFGLTPSQRLAERH